MQPFSFLWISIIKFSLPFMSPFSKLIWWRLKIDYLNLLSSSSIVTEMKTEHGNTTWGWFPAFLSARSLHVNKFSSMEWLDKTCELPLNFFKMLFLVLNFLSFPLWVSGYANKNSDFWNCMLEPVKFPSYLVPGVDLLTFWNPHFFFFLNIFIEV